jgi:plastocyanin
MSRTGASKLARSRVNGARPALFAVLIAACAAACATAAPVGNATGSPAATVELAAADLAFAPTSLQLPAGVVVALTLDNRDPGILHNVTVFPEAGGEPVFRGETFAGIATRGYLLGPLAKGTYRFICDVHPTMSGTLSIGP